MLYFAEITTLLLSQFEQLETAFCAQRDLSSTRKVVMAVVAATSDGSQMHISRHQT